MMFVLDTNIISDLRKKRPHPAVAEWIAETGWRELRMTVVSVTEIQRGIERTRAPDPSLARNLERWLDGMLAVGEPAVLEMGVAAARLLARMYETPALRHFVVTDPRARDPATGADLSIAAIAIAAGGVVATGNVRHFRQIDAVFPLPGLFNPFDRTWPVDPVPPSPPA
ncbi:MAG: PIN domain-containing protein [Acetobacteraceae bacterium]|nr:PIN domain-containing protein [Acetobacteraceae bacterium]